MKLNKEDFVVGVLDIYPSELIRNRISVESLVVASIWKDALLIDETNLTVKDFITVDARYYYSLASNLRKIGYSVLDEVTVMANMTETMLPAYEERGGWQTIQNIIDVVDLQNYPVYLDDLYKSNILLGLHRDGFNLLKEITENGKKFRPIDICEKLTSEQCLDWWESRLTGYGVGFSSKVLDEADIEFDEEWLESIEEGEEAGISFAEAGIDINGDTINCYRFLSSQMGGFVKGSLNCWAAASGVGKSTIMTGIFMSLMSQGHKVLLISNEQRISAFKATFLTWVLSKYCRYYKLTKTKLLTGNLNDEDKRQIKIAQEYWNENYKGNIKFVATSDMDMALNKKKIREYALKYGFDVFCVDTFKLEFDTSTNNKEYLQLIADSRELESLSKKYEMIGLMTMQLNSASLNNLFLSHNALSLSKQVKEVLSSLVMMRVVYNKEELDPKSKLYVRPFKRVLKNGAWTTEDVELDMDATYRMVFINKSRAGSTSDDTGIAYIMKFDGAHSVFREVAQCFPSHSTL